MNFLAQPLPEPDYNQWSPLLLQAAEEVRHAPTAAPRIPASFHTKLARSIERLASYPPGDQLEVRINAIARTMVDSCPLYAEFAPSFKLVQGALHCLERQRRQQHT